MRVLKQEMQFVSNRAPLMISHESATAFAMVRNDLIECLDHEKGASRRFKRYVEKENFQRFMSLNTNGYLTLVFGYNTDPFDRESHFARARQEEKLRNNQLFSQLALTDVKFYVEVVEALIKSLDFQGLYPQLKEPKISYVLQPQNYHDGYSSGIILLPKMYLELDPSWMEQSLKYKRAVMEPIGEINWLLRHGIKDRFNFILDELSEFRKEFDAAVKELEFAQLKLAA